VAAVTVKIASIKKWAKACSGRVVNTNWASRSTEKKGPAHRGRAMAKTARWEHAKAAGALHFSREPVLKESTLQEGTQGHFPVDGHDPHRAVRTALELIHRRPPRRVSLQRRGHRHSITSSIKARNSKSGQAGFLYSSGSAIGTEKRLRCNGVIEDLVSNAWPWLIRWIVRPTFAAFDPAPPCQFYLLSFAGGPAIGEFSGAKPGSGRGPGFIYDDSSKSPTRSCLPGESIPLLLSRTPARRHRIFPGGARIIPA